MNDKDDATTALNQISTATVMLTPTTSLSSMEGLPSFSLAIERGRFLHLIVSLNFFFPYLYTYILWPQRTVAPDMQAPNPVAPPPNPVVRAAVFREVIMRIKVKYFFLARSLFDSWFVFCSENSERYSPKFSEHNLVLFASMSGY